MRLDAHAYRPPSLSSILPPRHHAARTPPISRALTPARPMAGIRAGAAHRWRRQWPPRCAAAGAIIAISILSGLHHRYVIFGKDRPTNGSLSPAARLKRRVDTWVVKLRVMPRAIRVQRMTHKWGSCSTAGTITLALDLDERPADSRRRGVGDFNTENRDRGDPALSGNALWVVCAGRTVRNLWRAPMSCPSGFTRQNHSRFQRFRPCSE